MTKQEFLAFYPQFAAVPQVNTDFYVSLANLRFSDFEEDAEEARRLYTAHKLTLFARASPATGSPASLSELSSSGDGAKVASRKVGEVAVTFASSGPASAGSALAELSETVFGLQLLSLIRLHAWPRYVP